MRCALRTETEYQKTKIKHQKHAFKTEKIKTESEYFRRKSMNVAQILQI